MIQTRWSLSFLSCLCVACGGGDDDGDNGAADASVGQPDGSTANLVLSQIAGGGDHSCAIDSEGAVWCWGANDNGQLGTAGPDSSTRPLRVSGLSGVTAITTGWKHSCAIAGGQAYCWGANDLGQLGDGGSDAKAQATMVVGLADAIAIAGGDAHTCAIRQGGAVVCWGLNVDGQLGNGTDLDHITPMPVSVITGATAIAASFAHSCAVAEGKVYCWGENLSGQLGPGAGDADSVATPVEVTGTNLAGASGVACGDGHNCALAAGSVVCWGENTAGQLGNDSTDDTPTPTTVTGITGAVAVAASIDHTCASTASEVFCWGSNSNNDPLEKMPVPVGKIGQSMATAEAHTPQKVMEVGAASSIATGDQFSCMTSSAGSFCWGQNDDGELGNGGTDSAFAPTAITP